MGHYIYNRAKELLIKDFSFVLIKDLSLPQSPFLHKDPKKKTNPNLATHLWDEGEKY